MSPSSAVSTSRPPEGNILLAAEGRAAVPSISGFHEDFSAINEHGLFAQEA
jgi:hypothetical protein